MLRKRLGALNSNAQKETVEREDGGVYAVELVADRLCKKVQNRLPPEYSPTTEGGLTFTKSTLRKGRYGVPSKPIDVRKLGNVGWVTLHIGGISNVRTSLIETP